VRRLLDKPEKQPPTPLVRRYVVILKRALNGFRARASPSNGQQHKTLTMNAASQVLVDDFPA